MKNKVFIPILLALLYSCNSNTSENKANADSVVKTVPILKLLDKRLEPYLDTIIEKEKLCSYFDKKSPLCITSHSRKKYYFIIIGPYISSLYDYDELYGYFTYKNFNFLCYGVNAGNMFENTTMSKELKFPKIERSRFNIPPADEDTKYSNWEFIYTKSFINLYSYIPCDYDSLHIPR
jgi:hypothetical protein